MRKLLTPPSIVPFVLCIAFVLFVADAIRWHKGTHVHHLSFVPDYGTPAYDTNRNLLGLESAAMDLDQRFSAYVSTFCYRNKRDREPDVCFVGVMFRDPRSPKQALVCYQRSFLISNIAPTVLTAKATDVIAFSSSDRKVTFQLGTTNCMYILPLSDEYRHVTFPPGR